MEEIKVKENQELGQNPEAEPVSEPEPLRLTKDEMREIELHVLRIRCYSLEAELTVIKRDAYLQQVDPQGKILQYVKMLQNFDSEVAINKAQLNKMNAAIGRRLGINLSEFAYDDSTGILTKIPT